ncbi:Eco57I restriction-modification methylase domain-containing protein [Bifidobacterium pseudolongum]|uniref:Eco57I restriction-modification methylase domain-containing protein n=1 Tax=Bifidobacterium pseudolongum TaxID=1694 RepID=UPI0010ED64FC|nr:class I SAM-dependent DNA methyltransferase [Bifidobacterium pseudolongum]RYQ69001.1 restriction endonuclease subunit M [Bifidobacterium pseudolongum subsp. globosum]
MSKETTSQGYAGIEAVNGFYAPYYMRELMPASIKDIAANRWKDESKDQRPASRLRALGKAFTTLVNQAGAGDLDIGEAADTYLDAMLRTLGYDTAQARFTVHDEYRDQDIPLRVQCDDEAGSPVVQVLVSDEMDEDTGIMESTLTGSDLTGEQAVRMLLADQDSPARWILLLGIHQAALVERGKWADKQYLLFDFDTIYARNEPDTFTALAVLLSRDSLMPRQGGTCTLDGFDEASVRQAVEVSNGLRVALRECVEIIGNEVIHDWVHNKQRDWHDIDAGDLTVQCLRYMYRLLFLLFIETKPELGYAPLKSESYRTGYSLESLRDLAERMRGRMDEASDTTYVADTLRELDRLVYHGYPTRLADFTAAREGTMSGEGGFVIPPLHAHIFDPARTELIEHATLRDSVMLKVIDLMSVTDNGKKGRKERISYATLGINQMGAVYEGLLSYRGFIATETLYEVKKADKDKKGNDKVDELEVGYFVTADQLGIYSESERVYTLNPLGERVPRTHEPGEFVYRLAGRERETSASYYTPDSLAACLVKYALKQLEPHISQATDILKLRICEPAMGSATFLNETINQLAAWYLREREKELIAEQGPDAAIPADKRQEELQKVKMLIADRNIYGVDLNPVAVELAEVSLWLNSICPDSFVPWFGNQLLNGNSLIGAKRAGYTQADLMSKAKDAHWYDKTPKRIPMDSSASRTNRIYHFLVGDPGMCTYTDKVIKTLCKDELDAIKAWKKAFTKPCTKDETERMHRLSVVIDRLWRGQVKARRELAKETQDGLQVYGYWQGEGTTKRNLTVEQKDLMLDKSYKSSGMNNVKEYARLKTAMDYWCALWFWPIDQADQLPTRAQYLQDMEDILYGDEQDTFDAVQETFEGMDAKGGLEQETLDIADITDINTEGDREFSRRHQVNLDQLKQQNPRLQIVDRIASEQRFLHWELEFADVFADGGFDFMIGNPPWVRLKWEAAAILSDSDPRYAVKEISASNLNKQLPAILSNGKVLTDFIHAYESHAGQASFFNAVSTYPLLQNQKTNLFRCFLPNAWDHTNQDHGVSAFVHPDELYGDPSAGILREQIYRRLRYHFQFVNELKLFDGVHHETTFSLNVYQNSTEPTVGFDSIWNLYDPRTVDECYADTLHIEAMPVKDDEGHWNIQGSHERIVHIDETALQAFAQLTGDSDTDWHGAPMLTVYVASLLTVLERLASVPQRLGDLGDAVTYSSMWNETNARKDDTIKDDVHFPVKGEPIIYSSPFIGVGNPLLQSTRREYRVNSDYDLVDLTAIPVDYEPRVKYAQACSNIEYTKRMQKTIDGSRFDAIYRVAARRMVGLASERTLQSAILPPTIDWVFTINGYSIGNDYKTITMMSAIQSSIVIDYFVRSLGKGDVTPSTLRTIPVLSETCLQDEIRVRCLILNCLTNRFAALWKACWDNDYCFIEWSKSDCRLSANTFSNLSSEWTYDTPLRTDYARRQALVELDVLTAMALGLTLDQLIDMYRLTFAVLKQYEEDTWYDAEGRVTYSKKKAYKTLAYAENSAAEFEKIKHAPAGAVFTRTLMDDTLPGGPHERTVEYHAPFDCCDRVEDYRTAWAFFEAKYGQELEEERTRLKRDNGEVSA